MLRRRKPVDSVDDVILASPGNMASEVEHNSMMEKVGRFCGTSLSSSNARWSWHSLRFEPFGDRGENRRSPGHSKDAYSASADYVTKGVSV